MSKPNPFMNLFRRYYSQPTSSFLRTAPARRCPSSPTTRPQCLRTRILFPSGPPKRSVGGGPGLDPNFVSILDRPAKMARVGKQHGPGLIILAIIPITAFILGCWQVQRLGWKTELVARFEDRLTFPPLELPLRIDPAAIQDFDYRRVYARGNVHKILACRGWIKKEAAPQWFRKKNGALPEGEVTIEGLLRIPPKGNMFTPKNEPEKGKWFFPSVEEMAQYSGSQAVWVEETMTPDLLTNYEREPKGVPIGRAPTVNLRNNHTQYIFTWYALSFATSVMFWMVVKKPMSGTQRRVRHSVDWS